MHGELRVLAAIFSLLALFGHTQPAKAQSNASPVAVVPFREIAGHIFVKATIEGMPDLSVAIDTGSPEFLLSRKIYDRLRLPFTGMVNMQPGIGGDTPIPAIVTSVPSVRFGGITIKRLQALVLSLPPIDPRGDRQVDAIIGSDLFRRYVVEMDYAEKVLRFYDPSRYHTGKSGCELPLDIKKYPLVHAQIVGARGRPIDAVLFLDTAGQYTLLSKSFMALHPDLPVKYLNMGPQQGQGVAGLMTFRFGRISGIKLGACTIPNPVVAFPEGAGMPMGGGSFSGEIGLNIFERFTSTFDYRRGIVVFSQEH
jgi:hypothetical protein